MGAYIGMTVCYLCVRGLKCKQANTESAELHVGDSKSDWVSMIVDVDANST